MRRRSLTNSEPARSTSPSGKSGVVDLFVVTKSDLFASQNKFSGAIVCSAETNDGIDRLIQAITESVESRDTEETGSVVGTAARCQQSLQQAAVAIDAAVELTHAGDGREFVSAELRLAIECLGEVTGAVYTDDILDRVFGRFCIGK